MDIFIAKLYCWNCLSNQHKQVYALDFHAQHICMHCGDVSITKLKEVV